MYDIAVVGAGSAGLYAAHLYERFGLSVVVFEEHEEIGKPEHCSGLISWNLRRFVRVHRDIIENKVMRAVVHSPRDRKIIIEGKGEVFVINRYKLDNYLASLLCSEIMLRHHVSDIRVHESYVSIKTNKGVYKARVVVGADGPNSVIAKKINNKLRFKIGIIALVEGIDDSDHVDIYLNKEYSRDGFLWRIPRKNRTEYGIFGSKVDYKMLERFFGIKKYLAIGGLMPYGMRKSYGKRVILIGDAAGQTKPWSGGGVIYGMLAAKLSASVIAHAFEKERFDEEFLKAYEIMWHRILSKRIALGNILWQIYNLFPSYLIDTGFGLFGVRGVWKSKLDMDFIL